MLAAGVHACELYRSWQEQRRAGCTSLANARLPHPLLLLQQHNSPSASQTPKGVCSDVLMSSSVATALDAISDEWLPRFTYPVRPPAAGAGKRAREMGQSQLATRLVLNHSQAVCTSSPKAHLSL